MTPPAARPSPLGAWLERQLALRGVAYTSLRQDLALTGQSFPVVLSRKILTAATGFVLVAATGLTLQTLAAVAVPGAALAVAGAATAVAASFLPDLEARRLAAARRREFRRALAAYLDLVALEMAGSAAPTEALPNAARVGTGWPMALLRDTLWRAGLSGQDSWEALADLGRRIGVAELRDLAALIRLVGRDGARVRADPHRARRRHAPPRTRRRRGRGRAEGPVHAPGPDPHRRRLHGIPDLPGGGERARPLTPVARRRTNPQNPCTTTAHGRATDMTEIQLVVTWLRAHLLEPARRREDDGAGIVETVVIVGLFVAAAIIIVGILVSKATQAANAVKTQ